MNFLFEITTKDFMFIGLFGVGIILFGAIIFYVLSKGEKDDIIEEIKVEPEPEMFKNIKPKNKEQQEAKDELEKVFKQMSADLEVKKAPRVIEEFEREQEENAVISYQELIKQAEAKRKNPNGIIEEKIEEPLEQEEKISIEEEKPLKNKEELLEKIEKHSHKEEPKSFRSSDIISPIFGLQSSAEYQEERSKHEEKKSIYEKDLVYEDNNVDFLNSLKEFRKNL